MRNIVLIGMPGCGKSVIGKQLAKALARPCYDMDEEIIKHSGESIKALFAKGEKHFRNEETKVAKLLAPKTGVIIACGGGVVKRAVNMETLKATGTVIFLNREPSVICDEVGTESRPLLSAGREKVFTLYKERISLYVQAADYIVDVEEPFKNTVPKIIKLIGAETK